LVPFSRFALSDSFSALSGSSHPVFLFCLPGFVFGGSECVVSRFHVLRVRTHFRRNRRRRVPFSCFARLDSFSAVPRTSGPIFMFCAPGLVFGGTEGVGSRFHVLRSRTRFWRYRGRRVPFSHFALPDSFSCFACSDPFSAVLRAPCPVFMFCASGLIFGGTDGVGSRLHVLHSRTRFRRYRGRRIPFSCFALPDSFSAIPRASCPVSTFSLMDSFSTVPKASCPVFLFCSP
jgi:hypothetical protein